MINLILGDARRIPLADRSVQCCVTSPPYFGLRDYGVSGQIGLESTPDAYVATIVEVFREVRRVLRDDGTLWLVLGDTYCSAPPGTKRPGASESSTLHGIMSEKYRTTLDAGTGTKKDTSRLPGLKPKDLIGIPWMVAFALRADGWYLRSDIIWAKPNPMPESVRDRPTKSHEYLFLMAKSDAYHYDANAIKEEDCGRPDGNINGFKNRQGAATYRPLPGGMGSDGWRPGAGRNKRSVWTVTTKPYPEAHFATFPPALIEPCILAGCPAGEIVLDPFNGAGTTGVVAKQHGRSYVGIDLNPEYLAMSRKRIAETKAEMPLFCAPKPKHESVRRPRA